jgi:hypothetical protein
MKLRAYLETGFWSWIVAASNGFPHKLLYPSDAGCEFHFSYQGIAQAVLG